MGLFPPFLRSAADAVAHRLAQARTYAQGHPRQMRGVIGGLTAPLDPNTVGGEGFFSGLLRGVGGADRAIAGFDQMTRQQQMQDQLMEYDRIRAEAARTQADAAVLRAQSGPRQTGLLGVPEAQWPEYMQRYRALHPQAAGKQTQEDLRAAATASDLGISPQEARTFSKGELAPSGTRIVTGRQQFDPMKAMFTPAPPETIQTYQSERVQTLRDLKAANDPSVVWKVANQHGDPIVRAAAKRRLNQLRLGAAK